MQVTVVSLARSVVLATAMGAVMLGAAPVAASEEAAHSLADKFSRAAEDAERKQAAKKAQAERARAAQRALQQRRKAQARQKAYEEDMLVRARAEAAARRAKEKRIAQERARAKEQQRKAETARLAKEAEERRRTAEADRLAKEAEEKQLAEQRRKAEATRLAKEVQEKQLAEERQRAEAARFAKEAEQERLAEQRRKAARTRDVLEALRAEQARRIVRKFQRAREQRMREAAAKKKNGLGGPRPPVAKLDNPPHRRTTDQHPPVAEVHEDRPDDANDLIATRYPTRVTVLLIVEPRGRGRQRYKKGAHPVLCVGKRCYISSGTQDTAYEMSRRRALGPRNSLGRRAGPCNRQLVCAFRSVTLDRNPSYIQPIDMGLLRHGRRDIRKAEPDRTCTAVHGSLHCASVIIGHRYRAWIVPEAVAEAAGPEALEAALKNGLTTTRSARLVSGRAP